MAAGLLAVVVGYLILFELGMGDSQTFTYVGAGVVLFGFLLGNVSAVADAWYLRDTDIGAGVFLTVVLVIVLGPIWVLVALLRRQFGRASATGSVQQPD